MLDVSRIQAGQFDLVLQDIDLAALVREVEGRFEQELARGGYTLSLDAGAPVVGRWDRLRLEQVVVNLLSNSIRYGRGRPITIRVHGDALQAHLVVEDQGSGIATDRLGRIFDRFERGVSSQHFGGLGLGLFIVARIVERLGGTIAVKSDVDVGSVFTVDLPRAGRGGSP
jgi:signal transduction histidine kinase